MTTTTKKPRTDRFDPAIEPRWREYWEREGIFNAGRRPDAPNRYILEMFPYPSGDLHVGHLKNYVIGDALTRYYVARGYDVLHPFGWDAFGLPAENAAIKFKRHPREWTYSNIAESKGSLGIAGIMYDWSREVTTCAPDTISGTSGCSSCCISRAWPTAPIGWSTGIRSIRPCWRTSR